MTRKTIAIVGAGPIGLEAALVAFERNYDVTIFERGKIADSVRQWGHVTMFSPFEMNASARGIARLHVSGTHLPRPNALLTGAEFRSRYLEPLGRTMAAYIQEDSTVLFIGRDHLLKSDCIHDPLRASTSFRMLIRSEANERVEKADIVLDCSGTFLSPNMIGDGGIPAPGESLCSARIHYGIPNIRQDLRERFAGRKVLVIGSGHSAATAISELARTKQSTPQTEIFWLVRHNRHAPCQEIPNDLLPARASLLTTANRLVKEQQVTLISNAFVQSVQPDNGSLQLSLGDGEKKLVEVDEIIAATGFRPDLSLTRELQVQTCWATEGTYPLAASLLGETGSDCLSIPAAGVEMLRHPEPNFFTLGMKSYGRTPNFLLRTGYDQITAVFDCLDRQRRSQGDLETATE